MTAKPMVSMTGINVTSSTGAETFSIDDSGYAKLTGTLSIAGGSSVVANRLAMRGAVVTLGAAGVATELIIGAPNTCGVIQCVSGTTGHTMCAYIHGITGVITKLAGDAQWVVGGAGASQYGLTYTASAGKIQITPGTAMGTHIVYISIVGGYM